MDTTGRNQFSIDYRFKIIYAVAIMMVVGGHCSGGGLLFDFSGWFPYYDLHLALFLFCSGYFYKSSAEDAVKNYILKKIKHLIVPLYIYNFAYGIIVKLLRLKDFKIGKSQLNIQTLFILPITTGHQFMYNLGAWFVIPLFMIEIYNVIFRKAIKKLKIPEYIFFIINIAIGLIGNYIAYKGYNTGWWLVLVRMMHLIPYYGLGIFYKRCLEKYERRIPARYIFFFIFVIKLFAILTGRNQQFSAAWCNDFPRHPFIPIVLVYIGILFWMRLATILEPAIGKNKYLNLIADNTYSIMTNQIIFFMLVKTCFAVISKYTNHFTAFNWHKYKTDIWYYFIPNDIFQLGIIYLIAGITGPILLQLAINRGKVFVLKLMHNQQVN